MTEHDDAERERDRVGRGAGMTIAERLGELGITLPPVAAPDAYRHVDRREEGRTKLVLHPDGR